MPEQCSCGKPASVPVMSDHGIFFVCEECRPLTDDEVRSLSDQEFFARLPLKATKPKR